MGNMQCSHGAVKLIVPEVMLVDPRSGGCKTNGFFFFAGAYIFNKPQRSSRRISAYG